ncbi:hypothetical protein NLJ89_g7357 [Agrocybe chaxingu]|uniref:N-acetyltransferase domain-containing protein n=1 Tax=Agrocybe chaxingu TaxID=84603 RepID=A0A9W8MRU3_9AGAR|nr:hypothetical protein NLJ89_g7357 [Agrocybe chaxingu]
MGKENFDGSPVRLDKITANQTLFLRQSVLWPDKDISEMILPEDETGRHYGAFLSHTGDLVAVISLFVEEAPIDNNSDLEASSHSSAMVDGGPRAVRFRKFACDVQYQGKGIGTRLLTYALSMARSELNVVMAWCDARTTAMGWYQKRGFVAFGTTFYKGPVEYVRMQIDLYDVALQQPGSTEEHTIMKASIVQ